MNKLNKKNYRSCQRNIRVILTKKKEKKKPEGKLARYFIMCNDKYPPRRLNSTIRTGLKSFTKQKNRSATNEHRYQTFVSIKKKK